MKRIVIFLVISILSFAVTAQVQVYPWGNMPEKGVKYTAAITYALPTTTFKVTVSVSKVQEVKGYFADYAESLLGLTNIIKQNRTSYKLNSVDIEPLRTADMSNCFRAFTSSASIADNWKDNTVSLPPTFPDMSLTVYQTHTTSLPEFFKNYADISYTQQSESFTDTQIIDGVVTQVPASHTRTVSKTFESKAREAADAIMKSRKDQYNLVAGEQETAYSGEALQIMLNELKKWENNYMSLFSGVSVMDTLVYVFYVTPENLDATTLFYFNNDKGFNQAEGSANEAYMLNFIRFHNKFYELTDIHYPQNGYVTRNQQPVNVSLKQNNNTIHNFGIIDMYQAGALQIVAPSANHPINIHSIGIVF